MRSIKASAWRTLRRFPRVSLIAVCLVAFASGGHVLEAKAASTTLAGGGPLPEEMASSTCSEPTSLYVSGSVSISSTSFPSHSYGGGAGGGFGNWTSSSSTWRMDNRVRALPPKGRKAK